MKKLNENVDLNYQLTLKCAERISEEVRVVGRGKKKKSYQIKMIHWKEEFKDEDVGDSVFIERSHIIEVDGKKSNGWNELKYYTQENL